MTQKSQHIDGLKGHLGQDIGDLCSDFSTKQSSPKTETEGGCMDCSL